jgi:hypothetical protein
MPQSVTDFEVLMSGQTEPVAAYVRDPRTEDLSDVVGTSNFALINTDDDSTEVSQNFTSSGGGSINHPSTGIYEYRINTSVFTGEYIARFRCVLDGGAIYINQFVKSVSARHFKYAAALRAQVDKARKSVSDAIENMDRTGAEPEVNFFYGYGDKHLIFYLERGLQLINCVPPYTSLGIDDFPFDQYGTILIDAATIAALESQGIFAIDTDYSYALGGNSFVIDHFTKLSSMLSTMLARFDKTLLSFKQIFRSPGTVSYQWFPGFARGRWLNAMPSGFWSRMLAQAGA